MKCYNLVNGVQHLLNYFLVSHSRLINLISHVTWNIKLIANLTILYYTIMRKLCLIKLSYKQTPMRFS